MLTRAQKHKNSEVKEYSIIDNPNSKPDIPPKPKIENNVSTEPKNEITNDSFSENEEEPMILTDPKKKIQTLLEDAHINPFGGHIGINRTYLRLKRLYVWKNMKKDIENYIKKCSLCQKNKFSRPCKMPMMISKPPYRPFDKVFMDIVDPLPLTVNGNKYILTFQDDLTRFFDCYAMPDAEANTVSRIFYDEIISKYKIP